MEKAKNSSHWVDEGYTLFAREGLGGIQVERLARILQLNKSGFYHYFGDIDGFHEAILTRHKKVTESYLEELREIKTIDPDLFQLVVKYKLPVLFNMQSFRQKATGPFHKLATLIDQAESDIVQDLWSGYLGVHHQSVPAIRFFEIVRDMFYMRVTLENFDFKFLRNLFAEAAVVMRQLSDGTPSLEIKKNR